MTALPALAPGPGSSPGSRATRPHRDLGWLPALALVAASGTVLLAAAYTLVGRGSELGEPLFWLSFGVIAVPIVVRLGAAGPGIAERVGLVVTLGMALYLVHLLRSPQAFSGFDELLHYRSLVDVVDTGRLFTTNPLLTISPLFPGLEIITASVVQLTGADPFVAGNVVLAFVRILFSVALFLLYREAGSSDRIAGLATGIYMLNPNFAWFDSSVSYESLALPFVPVLLLITARRARAADSSPLSGTATVVAATLIITHHVTTIAMAALLGAWLVIHLIVRRSDRLRAVPIAFSTILVFVGTAIWFVSVGSILASYLGAPLSAAVRELIRLVASGEARVPFQSATGQVAPIWQRLLGLSTAGLQTLAIPIGLIYLYRRLRGSSLAILLGFVALAYPVTLAGRLTPTGGEAAGRTQAFVSLGLSFVVALAIIGLFELRPEALVGRARRLRAVVGLARSRPSRVVLRAAFVASILAVTLGGVVLGSAPATRFPGPFIVGADSRSITDEGIDTALWERTVLGAQRRIAADRVNRLLAGSYGRAQVVYDGSVGVSTWQLFLSPSVGPDEIATIRKTGIEYVVIDRRLSTGLPLIPFYYEEGEIFEGAHTEPVAPQVLAKWDAARGVNRIYDSGNIQLYDVKPLTQTP
jgi:hypothetical protein